jgi:hypothetical protein
VRICRLLLACGAARPLTQNCGRRCALRGIAGLGAVHPASIRRWGYVDFSSIWRGLFRLFDLS